MALHDPALIKSHAAAQRAAALANVPDYVVAEFKAMTSAQRRVMHWNAEFHATRHDVRAGRVGHPSAAYDRHCADVHRQTAAALQAIGL